MLTLLRSNQPIAWAIVPVTCLALAGSALARGNWSLEEAGTWAIGAFVTAALAHRLYRSFEYTAYANPALSWLLCALLFVAKTGQPLDAFWPEMRGWLALWAVLLGCWWMLGVHRQPRTSNLTFRAGMFAGLSWFLDPACFGFFIACAITLTKSRTFLLREWAMFIIGAVWIPVVSLALSWTGWNLTPENTSSGQWPVPALEGWYYIAGLLSIIGWGVLIRKTQFEGIRCKAARMNLSLLTLVPAAWAWWIAPGSSITLSMTALALSFAWVWLFDGESNGRRNPWGWWNGLAWAAIACLIWGAALAILGA